MLLALEKCVYEVGERVVVLVSHKPGEVVDLGLGPRSYRVRLDEGRQELVVWTHEIRPE